MAGERAHARQGEEIALGEWAVGGVAGVVGAVLFGLAIETTMPEAVIAMAIPATYGIDGPSAIAGWGLHLFHGLLLGLVYVGVVQTDVLREFGRGYLGAAVLGVAYGLVLTVGLSVIWVGGGFGAAIALPPFTTTAAVATLVGHVLYALPVAFGYAAYASGDLHRRRGAAPRGDDSPGRPE